jgi:hypothetical protein
VVANEPFDGPDALHQHQPQHFAATNASASAGDEAEQQEVLQEQQPQNLGAQSTLETNVLPDVHALAADAATWATNSAAQQDSAGQAVLQEQPIKEKEADEDADGRSVAMRHAFKAVLTWCLATHCMPCVLACHAKE